MTHPIVSRALQVAQRHPDWSSLQILDVAMDGHVETPPDFEVPPKADGYVDWLSPPSPFAKILLGAFGNHLDPTDFEAQAERWQEVIDAFGARYRLWR